MNNRLLKVEALALEAEIAPLLSGHHPGAQGAALCVLLVTWLKGHEEDKRERLLAMHVAAVRDGLKGWAK